MLARWAKILLVTFCLDAVSAARQDADWWKHTIVYQIYPRSFQDSDGDGVGDLKGIISRLEHFKYINRHNLAESNLPIADA
jgi:hypothetical protein